MPLRRLWVLISRLPPGSAVAVASSGGPDKAQWDLAAHLLAAVCEQIQTTNYLIGAVNTPKGKRNPVPEPHPIPRPGAPSGSGAQQGVKFGGRSPSSRAELTAVFGKPSTGS